MRLQEKKAPLWRSPFWRSRSMVVDIVRKAGVFRVIGQPVIEGRIERIGVFADPGGIIGTPIEEDRDIHSRKCPCGIERQLGRIVSPVVTAIRHEAIETDRKSTR